MAQIKLTLRANRERAAEVYERFQEAYPDACCSLNHRNPLQLLVATILAAQCTDERVNIVTKDLFKRYKTARDFADAAREELEEAIRSCGFYRQKTKSIMKTCARLEDAFGGKVPDTMDALLSLEGVGRKTANVILGECYGGAGIIVDTHCRRISNRLGFTKSDDPAVIERDLMKLLPEEKWTLFSHCMVFHGRRTCMARKPNCPECCVREQCPYKGKTL